MPDSTPPLEETTSSLWRRYHKSEYGPTLTTLSVKIIVAAGIGSWALFVSDNNNDAILDTAYLGLIRAFAEDAFFGFKAKVEHGRNPGKLFLSFFGFDSLEVGIYVAATFGMVQVMDEFDMNTPRLAIPAVGGLIGFLGLPYFTSMHHNITKNGFGIIDAVKQVPNDYLGYVKKSAAKAYHRFPIFSLKGIQQVF